jgi:hypothetical protein
MPKKTRKMKQRAAMRRAYQAPGHEQRDAETIAEPAETTVRMRPTTPSSRAVTPLTFDYTHIYGDLKRIALFAGFFFTVLIVLSFVIK